jgi:hypothetical protein
MECNHCGNCCKQDPKFWMGSSLVKIDFSNNKITEPDIADIVLNTFSYCQMLSPENLCMLQVKFGYDAKPQGCKEFSQEDCDKLRNKEWQIQNTPTI